MFEACKIFLYLLNVWKFESPSHFAARYKSLQHQHSHPQQQQHHHSHHHHHHSRRGEELADEEDNNTENGNGDEATMTSEADQEVIASYNISYHRWMCYNYVPSFCDSLEKHETVVIFGVPFLRLVFGLVKQDIEEKFLGERDRIPSEKRPIFANFLPR